MVGEKALHMIDWKMFVTMNRLTPDPETVALLQKLVQEDNDESSKDELNDEQQADPGPEVGRLAVQLCEHVYGRLAERDDESEDCESLVCKCPLRVCIYG